MAQGRFEFFNFKKFDDETQDRVASDKDVKELSHCIKQCVAKTRVTVNPSSLTSKRLTLKLQKIAASDFSNVRYLLCFFSSHGDGRSILTSDMEYYPLSRIIDHFNCDALKDIPKIFIVQSCRGKAFDDGHDVQPERIGTCDAETSPQHQKLKVIEDARTSVTTSLRSLQDAMRDECVVAFSTPPDRYSWRSKTDGGYYAQSLIHTLTEFHNEGRAMEVTRLLLATNQRIATQFSSQASIACGKKQIGEFVSTLTKRLVL